MKLSSTLAVLLFWLAAPGAYAEEDAFAKLGVYVVVADLDKSRAFYEAVFAKQAYVRNDQLVGFDIAGGLYALVSRKDQKQKLLKGNNAIPYIRVRDIDKDFARIASSGARLLDRQIVDDGPLRLFRFADPDGNVIEFFALK